MSKQDAIQQAVELQSIHGVKYAVVDTAGWVTPYQVVPLDSALERGEPIIWVTP